MSLTPEVIKVIKATAPVVAEHAVEITSTFYATMFKNNPEVLAFFNKSHQKRGQQPRSLADAVVSYATNIEHLDRLGPLVGRMAHRHVALSVKPEHYAIVHKNLMTAVGMVLGDAVTPEIGNAWSESVLALANILIDAEENLYKANEKRQGGWRYEREFEVAKREEAADDTVLFTFKPTDGYTGGFEFTPGQYTTVRCCDLTAAPRHYTIISSPGDAEIKIAQRKVDGGEMSNFMHSKLNVNDKVLLGAPCGVFVPEADDESVALISAGIGITPMVSFLRHYGSEKVKAALHLDHTKERDALSGMYAAAGVPARVIYTSTSGNPELEKEASTLFKLAGPSSSYLLCGPNGFMDAMQTALLAAGVPEHKVRYEVFGTGTIRTNAAAEQSETVVEAKAA